MADPSILIPRPLGSVCLPEENMILQRKFIHSFFISHKVDRIAYEMLGAQSITA